MGVYSGSMKKTRFFLLLILIISSVSIFARPISYPGGWTIMQKNDWMKKRVHIHYSPSATHSLGLVFNHDELSEDNMIGAQWNYLLKRKNTRYSQANIYLMTLAGANLDNSNSFQGDLTLAGDWESRRLFTSYMASLRYEDGVSNKNIFSQSARIGIAPYLAEYGSFHTWIMLQVDHTPEFMGDDQIVVTPLLRFFKGDFLWEIGFSDNKKFLFNWIIRL